MRSLGRLFIAWRVAWHIKRLTHSNPEIRESSREILAKIGEAAVDPLVGYLQNGNADVREKVAAVLSKIGYKPEDLDSKIVYLIAKRDWPGLVAVGKPAFERLVECLNDHDSRVRRSAVEALGKIGDERAVGALRQCMISDIDYVVKSAIEAIGKIGGAEAVAALIASLRCVNALHEIEVERALANIGNLAVGPLTVCLTDHDCWVRCYAAGALGQMVQNVDARAVQALIINLTHKESYVREAAVGVLGRIGDLRSVDPLIKRLQDSDSRVRDGAAKALVGIGQPAVEALKKCLKDENAYVRRRGAEALRDIGYKPTDLDSRIVYLIAARNWDELVNLGKPAVELLVKCLRDESSEVRESAVMTLGRIGDAQAVGPLIDCLLNDKEWYVPNRASKALVKIGPPAVEQLISCLRDSDLQNRDRIVGVLAGIGDIRAIEALEAYLKDSVSYPRWAAAKVLKEIRSQSREDKGSADDSRLSNRSMRRQRDSKMSQVQHVCPECEGKLNADDVAGGFAGICPLCGEWIEI